MPYAYATIVSLLLHHGWRGHCFAEGSAPLPTERGTAESLAFGVPGHYVDQLRQAQLMVTAARTAAEAAEAQLAALLKRIQDSPESHQASTRPRQASPHLKSQARTPTKFDAKGRAKSPTNANSPSHAKVHAKGHGQPRSQNGLLSRARSARPSKIPSHNLSRGLQYNSSCDANASALYRSWLSAHREPPSRTRASRSVWSGPQELQMARPGCALVDRRQLLELNRKQEPRLNVLPAVDGASATAVVDALWDERTRFLSLSRGFHKQGSLACILTNLRALRMQVELGVERMVLLEDDVRFNSSFVDYACTSVLSPSRLKLGEDVRRLGRFGEAYVITRAGASRLLECYCRNGIIMNHDNQFNWCGDGTRCKELRMCSAPSEPARLTKTWSPTLSNWTHAFEPVDEMRGMVGGPGWWLTTKQNQGHIRTSTPLCFTWLRNLTRAWDTEMCMSRLRLPQAHAFAAALAALSPAR